MPLPFLVDRIHEPQSAISNSSARVTLMRLQYSLDLGAGLVRGKIKDLPPLVALVVVGPGADSHPILDGR